MGIPARPWNDFLSRFCAIDRAGAVKHLLRPLAGRKGLDPAVEIFHRARTAESRGHVLGRVVVENADGTITRGKHGRSDFTFVLVASISWRKTPVALLCQNYFWGFDCDIKMKLTVRELKKLWLRRNVVQLLPVAYLLFTPAVERI